MTARVCPCLGCDHHTGKCPTLVDAGRCTPCARAADAARGRRQTRGYDANHEAERRRWARIIRRHPVACARGCGRTIRHGDTWHLDHTDDRTSYLGPSCVPCNTTAGARTANRGGG